MEAVQNNFLISIAPFIFVSPLSRNKHRISFQAPRPPQYIHRFSRVIFWDGTFFLSVLCFPTCVFDAIDDATSSPVSATLLFPFIGPSRGKVTLKWAVGQ